MQETSLSNIDAISVTPAEESLVAVPVVPGLPIPLDTKPHLKYLDGLRGIAAVYVLLHHSSQQFDYQSGHASKAVRIATQLFSFGHYAVDLFIVLSGFCLLIPVLNAGHTLRRGTLDFYRRRTRRIIPPYLCALGLSWLLISVWLGKPTGTHWDVSIPVTKSDVVYHLLLLQDIFNTQSAKINRALWSISVEWRIYFLFPLLVVLYRKWSPFLGAALVIAVSLLAVGGLELLAAHYPDLNVSQWGINAQYLGLFALGMLGAEIALPKGKLSHLRTRAPWEVLIVAFTILFFLPPSMLRIPWQVRDVILGLAAVCLLVSCTRTRAEGNRYAWLSAVLSSAPLSLLGTFAYSIYLIHPPLIQLIWQYALPLAHPSPNAAYWLQLGLGAPIIVAASFVFYLAFERPFLVRR